MNKENKNTEEEKLEDLEQKTTLKQEVTDEPETAKTEDSDQEKELSEADQLKEELGKEKDRYLRLFAEFENYKRRTGRERVELFKTAGQEIIAEMLPVLDDFDRALIELKKSADKDLLEGVELINNKLRETLRKKGLEEMKVKQGDKFDADLHEAVTQIPAPKKKLKGKIVDVIQKGYILGDKIIRYPKVVTGA